MDNVYYKLLVHIINLCNSRITSLESRDKAKLFQTKLEKYKIEDTLLFEYANGSIILLKDELFPQSIIDLVGNYDKLLAASKNIQPTFRITNIHANEAHGGEENNAHPILTINKEAEKNNLSKLEIQNQDYSPTQILNMSTTDHSVKDSTDRGKSSNASDIKRKIQNLSDELKNFN